MLSSFDICIAIQNKETIQIITKTKTKQSKDYIVKLKRMKVKSDHRTKFSNLSNWKEEDGKKSGL